MCKRFVLRVNTSTFSPEELSILKIKGCRLSDLYYGRCEPETAVEVQFMDTCDGKKEATSIEEKAWKKYIFRREWESDPNNRAAMGPKQRMDDEGIGGSRDYHSQRVRDGEQFFSKRKKHK